MNYNYDSDAFCNSLNGYADDPDYEMISDELAEKYYRENTSLAQQYFDEVYNVYWLWCHDEANYASMSALDTDPDVDYYAVSDKRRQEIEQVENSPYDYFLTLLNNDTEYYKEWAIWLRQEMYE